MGDRRAGIAERLAFNVNHSVRVRLTALGRTIIRAEHDKLAAEFPGVNWGDLPMPTEDENGWSEWQLWRLMEMFGAHLGNGRPLPFETEIELIPE